MFKEILQSRIFMAAIVILVGFLMVSLIKLEPALVTVQKELKNLNEKIAEVEKSAWELEGLGDYINSPAYLERQARIKLNYKKSDEKVVYVYTKTTEMQREAETHKIFENRLLMSLKQWLGYLVKK